LGGEREEEEEEEEKLAQWFGVVFDSYRRVVVCYFKRRGVALLGCKCKNSQEGRMEREKGRYMSTASTLS